MEASGTQTGYQPNGSDADQRSVGELVNQISENASTLIREEIELARAEIETKIRRLAQGAIVAGAAGFFALIGLIFVFETMSWGLNSLFGDTLWLGFLVTTVFLFVLAGIAGLVASRAFKAGAPPTPDTAIEEAKLIREALEHPEVQAAAAAADTQDQGAAQKQEGGSEQSKES